MKSRVFRSHCFKHSQCSSECRSDCWCIDLSCNSTYPSRAMLLLLQLLQMSLVSIGAAIRMISMIAGRTKRRTTRSPSLCTCTSIWPYLQSSIWSQLFCACMVYSISLCLRIRYYEVSISTVYYMLISQPPSSWLNALMSRFCYRVCGNHKAVHLQGLAEEIYVDR